MSYEFFYILEAILAMLTGQMIAAFICIGFEDELLKVGGKRNVN